MSKARLWVRKYLRHIFLAVSIAVFIAILGLILSEKLGVNIGAPGIQNMLLGVLLLSFITIIVTLIWYKIPLTPIQQRRNPAKWVSAEIKGVDTSQYLIYYDSLHVDYADFMVELESALPFDIELNIWNGRAIIKGNKTHSALECKANIKLPKHSSISVERWRLYNWTDCLKDLGYSHTQITITLVFSGEDKQHRHYELTTKGFNYEL